MVRHTLTCLRHLRAAAFLQGHLRAAFLQGPTAPTRPCRPPQRPAAPPQRPAGPPQRPAAPHPHPPPGQVNTRLQQNNYEVQTKRKQTLLLPRGDDATGPCSKAVRALFNPVRAK